MTQTDALNRFHVHMHVADLDANIGFYSQLFGGFLQAHPELVDEVDCSDQSTGADIDTPEHLHLLG